MPRTTIYAPLAPARERLQPLLAPRSIAFVGASPKANSPGNDMIRMARKGGFTGRMLAVNPNYQSVEDVPCFPSLAALPEPVDLAILSVANSRLEQAVVEAIAAKARAAAIFASAFLEGDSDPPLLARLAKLVRDAGMPVCGANCMGFYNDADGVWACGFPSPRERQAGGITLISHSGSAWGALAHNDARFKFNLVVSPGQEIATTAADYLDYALDLESTKVVGLFIETVRDPVGFVRALDKAARKGIPVVVLKVGRSERGAALALSHSGAIAGNDGAYQALFDRYGVIQVDTLDELGASLLLFAAGRKAAKGGIAVVHDSGGEREMAVDLAEQHAMPYAQINDATRARLAARLDPGLEPGNPLDAWGTGKDYVQIFEECTKALLDDPDTAMAMLCADIRDGYYLHDGYFEAMTAVVGKTAKPLAVATNYTQVRHDGIAQRLTQAGIPVLDGTLNAMRAAKGMLAHRDFLARPADAPAPLPAALTAAKREAWRARLRQGRPLAESEALDLLRDYGVPATPYRLVVGPEEAAQAASALGFPVALKTAMPEILHKSDVGGVALGLADAAAVRAAYADMAKRLGPKALVAPMAPSGTELALGVINDGQFGPVVMVAAGGILVELLRDAAHGLAPFGTATARRLIGKLRAAKLLAGVRGRKPADMAALADAVARLSALAHDLGDLIAEIDVNPVIAGPSGVVAVDALVVPRKP